MRSILLSLSLRRRLPNDADLLSFLLARPPDRKQQLTTLLQSLLHTYRALTSDLLLPAQPYDVWVPAAPFPSLPPDQQQQQQQGGQPPGFWTQSTEAKDRLKHIQNVVINMQFLINELRPTQAKETLKLKFKCSCRGERTRRR